MSEKTRFIKVVIIRMFVQITKKSILLICTPGVFNKLNQTNK